MYSRFTPEGRAVMIVLLKVIAWTSGIVLGLNALLAGTRIVGSAIESAWQHISLRGPILQIQEEHANYLAQIPANSVVHPIVKFSPDVGWHVESAEPLPMVIKLSRSYFDNRRNQWICIPE